MRRDSEWRMAFMALALLFGSVLANFTIGLSKYYMIGVLSGAALLILINIIVVSIKHLKKDNQE